MDIEPVSNRFSFRYFTTSEHNSSSVTDKTGEPTAQNMEPLDPPGGSHSPSPPHHLPLLILINPPKIQSQKPNPLQILLLLDEISHSRDRLPAWKARTALQQGRRCRRWPVWKMCLSQLRSLLHRRPPQLPSPMSCRGRAHQICNLGSGLMLQRCRRADPRRYVGRRTSMPALTTTMSTLPLP